MGRRWRRRGPTPSRADALLHLPAAWHQTLATVCTQIHCPTTPGRLCNLQPTQPGMCGLMPPSFRLSAGRRATAATPWLGWPRRCIRTPRRHCARSSRPVRRTRSITASASARRRARSTNAEKQNTPRATLCTQVPHCPPHTVHNSMCICPTPSAVHQCGGQTAFTPTIPQLTARRGMPDLRRLPVHRNAGSRRSRTGCSRRSAGNAIEGRARLSSPLPACGER